MMRLGAAVTLALVWAVSVGAQATPSNPPDTPPQSNPPVSGSRDSLSLPKGTGIVGILSTNLDTKHSKVGDRVEVEVTQDVNRGGDILLRRGSHITGNVTLAYAFSKGDSTAKLEIVFDKVVAKSGEQIPAYLAIFALAAKNDPTADDVQDPRGLNATAARAGSKPTGGWSAEARYARCNRTRFADGQGQPANFYGALQEQRCPLGKRNRDCSASCWSVILRRMPPNASDTWVSCLAPIAHRSSLLFQLTISTCAPRRSYKQ
jgi:hypothetical protein